MNRLEKKLPPLALVIIVAILMWLISKYAPLILIPYRLGIVTLLVLIALGIIFFGLLAFWQARTTVDPRSPEAASELVISGIYKFTRNPMYLGFAVLLLAWAILLASAWSVLMIGVYILYLNRFQIYAEERALTEIFGVKYQQYQAKVRRWL